MYEDHSKACSADISRVVMSPDPSLDPGCEGAALSFDWKLCFGDCTGAPTEQAMAQRVACIFFLFESILVIDSCSRPQCLLFTAGQNEPKIT